MIPAWLLCADIVPLHDPLGSAQGSLCSPELIFFCIVGVMMQYIKNTQVLSLCVLRNMWAVFVGFYIAKYFIYFKNRICSFADLLYNMAPICVPFMRRCSLSLRCCPSICTPSLHGRPSSLFVEQ